MDYKLDKPLEEYEVFKSPNTGKEVNIKSVVERIDFIRGSVYSFNPCFAALLDNLNFIYTFDVPTQATDGTRLFINPEWTQTLTDGEIRFVMIHELLHCVFNHMQRSHHKDKRLSNISADFEVNGAAYLDKFVTQAQIDHVGAVFSEKYINTGYVEDLWSYEAIYDDLEKNGFIPDAPMLDIIWPRSDDSNPNIKGIHTSKEWKAGHKDAKAKINKILDNEYKKINKHIDEKYKPEEVVRALENSIQQIIDILGTSVRKKSDIVIDEDIDSIDKNYRTYAQGWDYCVGESIEEISKFIFILSPDSQSAMKDLLQRGHCPSISTGNGDESQECPATDAAEEQLNIPRPPKYQTGDGNNEKNKLSKEDILSQQEGANIARKNGYKGEFAEETELNNVKEKWDDAISKAAGKEGSALITRHILDVKASDYNWQYELRKLLNYSMNNSMKYNNEWGEKRGLARDTMTLKHKSNNNAMKDIVFLVDCSGSISDKTLSDILAECYSISRKCNIKDITYAYFTTRVELVETNRLSKFGGKLSDIAVMLLKNTPKGGHITGGTDFKNALDWVNDIGGARCVIMLTDGYDTPVSKPSKVKNLIWCVYDNKNFKTADSSRVIYLDSSVKHRKIYNFKVLHSVHDSTYHYFLGQCDGHP